LAIRPPAEYHSAKPRFGIGTSLRYKPASIRIGGSAKKRPIFGRVLVIAIEELARSNTIAIAKTLLAGFGCGYAALGHSG